MLDFDLSYFEEETRAGFTIPDLMKHAWASELELLAKVDKICEENNIPYFANWGTLLGTVRHKGYIPWDDDIDLCMKRADLNRFCDVINNYDGILIRTSYNTPGHGFHAARVMNSTMFTIERDVYKDYHGFPFPVGLDIFVLDYVSRDKEKEKEQVEAMQVCSTAYHEREWLDEHNPLESEYIQHLAEYKAAVTWLETNCGVVFAEENPEKYEIMVLHEEIRGVYGEEDADYITELNILASGGDYYIPKSAYDMSIRLPFENTTIPVPLDYDYILRKKYGDSYMTPRNISAGHEYPFYNAFIRAIYNEATHKSFEGACEYIKNISSRFYIDFRTKASEPVLDIEESFFDEEELDDRCISSEDKRCIAASLEVLEEFKRLCKVIDIPYYAVGNTLDIDNKGNCYSILDEGIHVALKRSDVQNFTLILGQRLGAWFNYSTLYSSENHEDMRMIIRSDRYKCDEMEFRNRFHGYAEEVEIYISTLDNVDADDSRNATRKMLIENLITTARNVPSNPPYSEEIINIADEWKRVAGVNVNMEHNLRREFLRAADNIGSAGSEEGSSLLRVTSSMQNGVDILYNRDDFGGVRDIPFFVTTISVPIGFIEDLEG